LARPPRGCRSGRFRVLAAGDRGAAPAAAVAGRRAVAAPLEAALLATAVAGGWFFAADLGAWHVGIHLTKLANATLFANASSFAFAAYGFWLARAAPTRVQIGALVLAAAGVALLMGGSYELSPRYFRGDLLSLLAALFYTGYLIAIGRARATVPSLPLLTLATIAAAVPLLVASLMLGETVVPTHWTPLVLLALGSQIVGQGLLVYAMGHLSPLVVGLGLLTQPATAAVIGWFAYAERLTPLDAIGAVAIGAALVLVRLPPRAARLAPSPR